MPQLSDILRNSQLTARAASPEARTSKLESPASNVEPAASGDRACPICKGVGFVRQEVPLDHPEFGQALPCRCVEEESQEGRLARLQRYSNLGPLTRLTFDNLARRGTSHNSRDQASFQQCVDDAEVFAQDPQGWLLLKGASGGGKTHIAAAIANRCLERGIPALFVVVPDLLDHLRAAYRPDADVSYDQLFDQVRNAPALILDDLGTQSATPWAQEKLFQLINHRFNARLPTVVTTNVSLQSMDERLRARLTDPELVRVYEIKKRTVLDHEDGINMIFQPRIRSMSFDNFDVSGHGLPDRERESLENALRACRIFAERPEGWVVLTGEPGCGKTHLAAAIANQQLRQGVMPMFVKVSRLLQLYRSTFDEGANLRLSEIKAEIANAPLLVLDDLFFRQSKTYQSDWANQELFDIIDSRYENQLHTVFTTALTEAAMTADEVGLRFAARLWDYSISMELQIKAKAYKLPRKKPSASRRSA